MSEIRRQLLEIGRRNSSENSNANQVSERPHCLSKSVCTRDGNFRVKQRLSRRGKVLTYRSNPAFLPVCLYKSARGMGKTQVRSSLVSKLTDADGENGETETWLDFAHDCDYLSKRDHALFTEKCHEVGAMLGSMINDPSSFIL